MSKRKILIIDDDIVTLKILKNHLNENYDVRIEDAGYRFIEKPEEYDADLILLDVEMPIMNGIEVFEKYMSKPLKKKAPVMFLTGLADPSIVKLALSSGAKGYLIKTATKGELISAIEKVLNEVEEAVVQKQLLIVDYDILFLTGLKKAFDQNLYKLQLANSLLPALDFVQKHNVDLVLLGHPSIDSNPSEFVERFETEGAQVLLIDKTLSNAEIVRKTGELFE